MTGPASFQSQTFLPDQLVAGPAELLFARNVTVSSGQGVLTRGAVLGRVTAGGEYVLSLSAAGDGSEVPDAILAEDIDATGADVVVPAYFRGDFREAALTIGTGHTAASIREGLRGKGIFLVSALPF